MPTTDYMRDLISRWENDFIYLSHLHRVRHWCKSQTDYASIHNLYVAECMYEQMSELQKAVIGGRQYVLTLWPAFVGFVCSLGPDPYYMVYDNLWWAILFAITSGALPGLTNRLPEHHVEAYSIDQARLECEGWMYNPQLPRTASRTHRDRDFSSQRGMAVLEWFAFYLSLFSYVTLCFLMGWFVSPAFVTF